MKIYFYNWKRLLIINSNNSFERKKILRKIVNEKIMQSDYFLKLMKFSLINFLRFYKNFSQEQNKNNNNGEININYNKDIYIYNKSELIYIEEYEIEKEKEKENIKNKIIDVRAISSNVE